MIQVRRTPVFQCRGLIPRGRFTDHPFITFVLTVEEKKNVIFFATCVLLLVVFFIKYSFDDDKPDR